MLFEDGIECVSIISSEHAQSKLLERLELIGKEHMDGHAHVATEAKSNIATHATKCANDADTQSHKKA